MTTLSNIRRTTAWAVTLYRGQNDLIMEMEATLLVSEDPNLAWDLALEEAQAATGELVKQGNGISVYCENEVLYFEVHSIPYICRKVEA